MAEKNFNGNTRLKCPNCPERNDNSPKTGSFKVYFTNHEVILKCPYCEHKQVIPLRVRCYDCDKINGVQVIDQNIYRKLSPIKGYQIQ